MQILALICLCSQNCCVGSFDEEETTRIHRPVWQENAHLAFGRSSHCLPIVMKWMEFLMDALVLPGFLFFDLPSTLNSQKL